MARKRIEMKGGGRRGSGQGVFETKRNGMEGVEVA